ncbi:sensor histidine kinase [Anaeromicropila herbilytica]|nr:7TM diverse intracellular signaling domain-containing protein [Anaeromicropila herbilytica]
MNKKIEYSTTAKNGYIDLSNNNLNNFITEIDGEWKFYPMDNTNEEPINIMVPGRWNENNKVARKMGRYGYGTYKLQIKVPKSGYYGLDLRYIPSAYEVYINGRFIASNGVLGKNLKTETASWRYQTLTFYTETVDVNIEIKISNYHNNKGGIISSILLGQTNNIQNNVHEGIIKSAIIIGVFAGLGLYLILLYHSDLKKFNFLHVGLFCLSSMLLESISDVNILNYLWSDIPFNLITKLQYFAFVTGLFSLQFFIRSIYREQTCKKCWRIISTVNALFLLAVIIFPIRIFVYDDSIYMTILILNLINIMYTLIKAIRRRKKHSIKLTFGFIFMVLTISIDILSANKIYLAYVSAGNYNLGLLFFAICGIYVLSEDIIEAFISSNQAKDMEIAFLQAQIAPHFFFNTLNNIYCIMGESVPTARNLILDFCNFLRVKHKFDYRENVFYTLKEELDLIRSYFRLESAAYGDAIQLAIKVPEEFEGIMIPQLILQPIVENAIKHARIHNNITIEIQAIKIKDKLQLMVSDNGVGMREEILAKLLDKDCKSGIGLKNINDRLIKCYQTRLNIKSTVNVGTKVFFEIPIIKEVK